MKSNPGRFLQALFLSFLMVGLLSSCRGSNGRTEIPSLSIAVESSLEEIATVLVDAFNKANPQGIPLMVTVIPDDELTEAPGKNGVSAVFQWREPSSRNWSALLGWTGIFFAVHPDNPVTDVSSIQARRIYLGWISRWEDIGGWSGDIHAFACDPEAGWGELFGEIVLQGNRLVPGARIVPSGDAMAAAIAKDPRSIGWLPGFHKVAGIRTLTIDKVGAEYPNLISGAYPFRIPLYLVAETETDPEIIRFAGWAQSVAGQAILLQRQ